MRKLPILLVSALLFLGVSSSAFADITLDPVFFCNPPASQSCNGDPNIITSATSFGMFKNGSGVSDSPWDLIIAIPDYAGAAPTITSDGGVFTLGTVTDYGQFLPTTKGSIYTFAGGKIGDSSMNASNLFGSAEQAAFGGTPTYFRIFDYSFTPGFNSWVAYSFTVGGSGLTNGTFLAATGGSHPFSTPFTTTGLVGPPPSVPDGGATLIMLGAALMGLGALRRRFNA